MLRTRPLRKAAWPICATASAVIAAFSKNRDGLVSAPVKKFVDVGPGHKAVTVTPEPSTFSHSFKVLATVTSVAPGHGTPTGQVQLYVDGAKTGAKVTLSGGKATITVNIALTRGNHAIVVKFLGSANFSTSHSATVTHHIL